MIARMAVPGVVYALKSPGLRGPGYLFLGKNRFEMVSVLEGEPPQLLVVALSNREKPFTVPEAAFLEATEPENQQHFHPCVVMRIKGPALLVRSMRSNLPHHFFVDRRLLEHLLYEGLREGSEVRITATPGKTARSVLLISLSAFQEAGPDKEEAP